MQGRRRRDEPFNPFAPNASQNARDRREKREKNKPRPVEQKSEKTDPSALEERRLAALKAIDAENRNEQKRIDAIDAIDNNGASEIRKNLNVSNVKSSVNAVNSVGKTATTRNNKINTNIESRQERLARLAEKSAATAKFAKEASTIKPEIQTEKKVEIVPEVENVEREEPVSIEDTEMNHEDKLGSHGAKNVFKTIKTEIKAKDPKGRKKRSSDKKGGGKQPQTKKLDRRKMLEYKYVAKDILNNELVKEEHRSNISAQIWAKGERTGVESAIEFIKQKQLELILPDEIANELMALVKKYTTRR